LKSNYSKGELEQKQSAMKKFKIYVTTRRIVTYFVIGIILLMALLPLYLTVTTSAKDHKDAFAIPPKFLFFRPTIQHYLSLSQSMDFKKYYINSVIVSFSSVFIALLIAIPAAYALVRYNFKGKEVLAFLFLTTRMFPPIGLLIPFFVMWTKMGFIDTKMGLILVYLQLNLALTIWMLRGFLSDLPVELEEAGMVDGCSRLGAFLRITLPLVVPGLTATAILTLVFTWNEFLYAFSLTGRDARTATVAIYNFIGYEEIEWGRLQAGGTLVTLPILIFALSVEKYLVRGLTAGAIK
jgi:multiple sugar transport system permease protein